MIVILMGVCGSGKTVVGQQLAEKLGVAFHDGDDFHPARNVEKMSRGEPLDDADRRPWLERMAAEMAGWEQAGGAVLACSALRETYREILRGGAESARFVYLKGSRDLIRDRMEKRKDHFMRPGMIESQFAALEEPRDALTVDIAPPPETIVEEILRGLHSRQGE